MDNIVFKVIVLGHQGNNLQPFRGRQDRHAQQIHQGRVFRTIQRHCRSRVHLQNHQDRLKNTGQTADLGYSTDRLN